MNVDECVAASLDDAPPKHSCDAREILLNVKLVPHAQKDWMHSNHVQPVLLQIVHLRLHVTIGMLVTTVSSSTT